MRLLSAPLRSSSYGTGRPTTRRTRASASGLSEVSTLVASLTAAGAKLVTNEKLGLLEVPPMDSGTESVMSRHPIDILIAQGKQRAAEVEAKIASIVSLEDAVRDYEQAFGMKPPRGFERW